MISGDQSEGISGVSISAVMGSVVSLAVVVSSVGDSSCN